MASMRLTLAHSVSPAGTPQKALEQKGNEGCHWERGQHDISCKHF